MSASHYQFGDEPSPPAVVLGSAELESLPDIGEDPVRAIGRLPGVAGQDFTSRYHLRGGTEEETLIRYDDLRLYNPYHLKDFFGVFSSIDPAIVSDIRIYTGGFPVAFGDRSSGVVDIAPRLAGREFQGEAVASFFSVGASLDGATGDGATDWAFAARRGNMDVFFDQVDSPLGEPEYHDVYGRLGHRFNDWLAVSANALVFNDEILAFDSDQEEEAAATYRDQYYWLRADLGAPDGLGGRVLAAQTQLQSERTGSADLPGVGSGSLADEPALHDQCHPGGRLVAARRPFATPGGARVARPARPLRLCGPGRIRAPVPDARRTHGTVPDPGDPPAAFRAAGRGVPELEIRAQCHDSGRPRHPLGSRNAIGPGWLAMEPARGAHVAAARRHAPAPGLGPL